MVVHFFAASFEWCQVKDVDGWPAKQGHVTLQHWAALWHFVFLIVFDFPRCYAWQLSSGSKQVRCGCHLSTTWKISLSAEKADRHRWCREFCLLFMFHRILRARFHLPMRKVFHHLRTFTRREAVVPYEYCVRIRGLWRFRDFSQAFPIVCATRRA